MAGLTTNHVANEVAMPGMGEQIGLVAQVRWKLFLGMLRSDRGKLELAARIVMAILAGMGAVGMGLAFGALTYAGLERVTPLFSLPLWAVFLCWQVVPVVMAGFVVEFDFRHLLRFPLRFPAFVALSLTYGILDPPSLVALFWTGCVAAGVLLSQPEAMPAVLLVLFLFSAANLLINRVFLSWLQKILVQRRTRETLLAVVLLGVVGLQLAGALAERWEARTKPVAQALAPLMKFLPPGAAATALKGAARGELGALVQGSATLTAYGLVFALLLQRRLRRQYLGEDSGEGAATPTTVEKTVQEGWRLPGLSGPVAAMGEKELRYAIRNGQTWMSLLMPLVMVVFFSVAWSVPKQRPGFLARSPDLFFPGAVAYGMLILTPLLHNTFAFEGRGIQFLLVSPARFQEVLLAKNLVHGGMVFVTALLTWGLTGVLLKPPGAEVLAVTFSALVLVTLAHFMIGNALSLYLPRQIEFGHFRKRASQLNVLTGLFSQLVVLGIVAAILYQTRAAAPERRAWLCTAIFLALSAAAGWAYRASLDWSAQVMLEQREKLTAELTR